MGTKVVYNAGYGGFSLSNAAARSLNKRKGAGVVDVRHGFYDGPRHDVDLVAVVEALGDAASGRYSNLCIVEITGDLYRIDEYDGYESVQEPADIGWVHINSVE